MHETTVINMSLKKELLFQEIFVFCIIIACAKTKVVEIDDGKILGTIMTSRNGNEFDAFLRIPYAQPPIEDLRFQAPLPAKSWKEIRNGTYYGSYCHQQGEATQLWPVPEIDTKPSESCLFLNVFTMNLPGNRNSELKPVIVFIHGGGWEGGSGNWLNPHYIIDRDIVFVTINYRLGALGFLSVGTKDAIGNMGLKDQHLALQWVQKNIAKFGGNPQLVTVSGSSAGAFSSTAHMLSPMSRGLFHNVLASSGAIAFPKKLEGNQLPAAKQLATSVGCETEDVEQMVACLKKVPVHKIASMVIRDIRECPLIPWLPVIEPDFGQDRFFIEQPVESLKSGNFSKVPIIIGMTTKEFISPTPGIMANKTLMQQFNDHFEEVAPLCSSFVHGTQESKKISDKLRELYFQSDPIDIKSFESLGNLVSDGFISYAVHRFAHLASKFTDVYYYKFSYIGSRGSFPYPHNKPFDSCHGDEQQYIFPGEEIWPWDREDIMVERMTRIYSQFAWFGTPNNSTDEFLKEMHWPKLNDETEYYIDIGEHFIEKHGFYLDRFKIWDNLFDTPEDAADDRGYDLEEILALILVLFIACLVVKLYLPRAGNFHKLPADIKK